MPKRKSSTMWGSSSSSSNNNNSSSSNKKSFKASGGRNANSKCSGVNTSDVEKLWLEIADEGTVASMEGISVLCEKLDLDPLEDIRVLVLLWKLEATSKPAQITKDEWMKGCERLQVDSVEKFQDLLPSLELGFLDNDDFKDFYKVSETHKYVCVGHFGHVRVD